MSLFYYYMVALFMSKCSADKEGNDDGDLLLIVSRVFTKIIIDNLRCKANTRDISLQKELPFYSDNIPNISIREYCDRIVRLTHCEEGSVISSLLYVDRVCKNNNLILTLNNVHKMIFTAMIISIKYNEDECYTDDYYAKVGGISLLDHVQLQHAFLQLIKYNLYISDAEYAEYRRCVSIPDPCKLLL